MEMEIGKPFHIILGVEIYASAREKGGGGYGGDAGEHSKGFSSSEFDCLSFSFAALALVYFLFLVTHLNEKNVYVA